MQVDRLKHRELITLLGGIAATCPSPARAQHRPRAPRIGIVDDAPMLNSFRQALAGLPVELPTRLDLAINLETARVLDLPPRLVARADEVIE
ncbi:MAG TPA: hypothetical protein VGF60_04325 [Xanthobacteraceae bacterium]|jgi:hypothetical protein